MARRPYGAPVNAPPAPGQRQVKPRREAHGRRYRRASVSASGILLVEDDEAIASGLTRVLESQGYTVRRLARGVPSLAAADGEVSLVILDLGLPDTDGIEVC